MVADPDDHTIADNKSAKEHYFTKPFLSGADIMYKYLINEVSVYQIEQISKKRDKPAIFYKGHFHLQSSSAAYVRAISADSLQERLMGRALPPM